jgi:hypothetical protein
MYDFYAYIYYDPPRNNIPMYVGKGKNNRAWEHLFRETTNKRLRNWLKTLRKNNVRPIIGLYSGLDEELSLLLEKELISKFGRKDLGLGTLYNLSDGGEGPNGYVFTDDARSKISRAHKGKPKSAETKERMRLAKLGKKFSEQHKKNLSSSHKMINKNTE